MHVLIYSDDPGIGGVAQFDHMFSLGLRAAGFRAGLVQTRQNSPRADERVAAGVEHHWLDYDTVAEFTRTFTRVDEATALLARARPDFILFSDSCPVSNFAGKQAAAALGIPFAARVGFVAPYLAENFAVHLPRLAELYRLAAGVVAVSQENLRLMEQLFGLPPERGRVIYSGKGPAYFRPPDPDERRARRARLGIPDDGVLCFTAARLEMVKGYQYQLAAIEKLRAAPEWDRLYFAWAGPGSLQPELERILGDRGLRDRVHLLGQCWDVPAWLDAADIFVLPAQAEGLPQAVMEAMAKRLPVISTHVSGIPEALGDTGVLLPDPQIDPAGVADGLARHIAALAADPARRRAMGDACFRRADRHFHAERMVADYIALITGQRPAPPAAPPPETAAGLAAALAGCALPAPGVVPAFRARLCGDDGAAAARLAGLWDAHGDELADFAAAMAERRAETAGLGLPAALGDGEAELIYLLIRTLQPELVCDIGCGRGEAAAAALAALTRNGRGRLEMFEAQDTVAGLPVETAFRCALPAGCDAARHRLTIGDPRRAVPARLGAARADFLILGPLTDDVMAEWAVKTLPARLAGPALWRGVLHGDGRPVATPAAVYLLSFLQHAGAQPLAFGRHEGRLNRARLAARHPVPSAALLLGAPATSQPANSQPDAGGTADGALIRLLDGGGPAADFPLTSERLHPGALRGRVWDGATRAEDRYVAALHAGALDRARPGLAELLALNAHFRANPGPGAGPVGLLEDWAGRAGDFDPAAAVLLLETAALAGAGTAVARLLETLRAAPPPGAELTARVARVAAAAMGATMGATTGKG